MSGGGYPKFRNDRGVPEIRIGVKEFMCIGESPPHDHPHIYINMGEADTILCHYCATRFRFDPRLTPLGAEPPDSIFGLSFALRRLRSGPPTSTVGCVKEGGSLAGNVSASSLSSRLSRSFSISSFAFAVFSFGVDFLVSAMLVSNWHLIVSRSNELSHIW